MSSADSISLAPLTPNIDSIDPKKCEDWHKKLPEIRRLIQESAGKPRRTFLSRVFYFFTTIITTFMVLVFGIIGNVFQILTVPLMLINRPLVIRWHSYLAGFIWSILQHLYEKQSGLTLTISGLDAIPMNENAFVLSNHVCFADFAVIHSIAIRRHMLSFCKYFVKDSVKYLPIFGWGMKIMGMVMLRRNWAQDRAKFHELFSLFTNGQLPVYMVSFPEGSRVTPAKLQKSQDHAREHKLPVLDNVLLPRSKGFIATMLGLRDSDVHMLYDVTCVYYHRRKGLNRPWTFSEMFTSRLDGYHLHIHVDRIPFDKMPKGEDELKAWIFTQFKLKDGLVSSIGDVFRETFEVKQA